MPEHLVPPAVVPRERAQVTAPSLQPTGITPTAQSWHTFASPHRYLVLAGWAGDMPPARTQAISPMA